MLNSKLFNLASHINRTPLKNVVRTVKTKKDNSIILKGNSPKIISNHLQKHLKEKDHVYMQICLGADNILDNLIESNIQSQICLIDGRKDILESLKTKYSNKPIHFLNHDYILRPSLHHENFTSYIDKLVEPHTWQDEVKLKLFGNFCNNEICLYCWLLMLSNFRHLFSIGRVDLFAILNSKQYSILTAKPLLDDFFLYRAYSVLFQNFCEIELLEKIPKEDIKNYKLKKFNLYPKYGCDENAYFVHISPRKDLLQIFGSRENILNYCQFIRHLSSNKKDLILLRLESVVKDISTHLIWNHHEAYSRFDKLTPDQMLKLYHDVVAFEQTPPQIFANMLSNQKVEDEIGEESFMLSLDHT